MNKQELLDKAVHEFSGKWKTSFEYIQYSNGKFRHADVNGLYGSGPRWFITEFQQRARELGYINGYRWGVEYETNGSKPDLPDDVIVSVRMNYKNTAYGWVPVRHLMWSEVHSFGVYDHRYKPADTSYLDAPKAEPVEPAESEGWYDYDNQKALRLPPVGVECEINLNNPAYGWTKVEVAFISMLNAIVIAEGGGEIHSNNFGLGKFRPLDWNRKAKAERKRVVDTVSAHCDHINESVLFDLYDAGCLRLPPETN